MKGDTEGLCLVWGVVTLVLWFFLLVFVFPQALYEATKYLNSKILFAQLWAASTFRVQEVHQAVSSTLSLLSWFVTELEKAVKMLHGH